MKKTILHFLSTKLALASFLLAGLFLFAPDQLSAQANLTTGAAKQSYVSEQEAINRLEVETAALKVLIESLVPETLAYRTAVSKYDLFSLVLNKLRGGISVKQAVAEAFVEYDTDAYATVSESIRTANKNELLQILEA